MGMLKERRRQIEEELLSLDNGKQQLEDRLDCAEEDKSKLALAQRIVDLINEYKEIQVSSRIGELEATITHAYRKLANKRDMVERIEINEETFEVTLINKNGVRVDRGSISAGEQEIFAIAVLWGLADMSGHRMPMVIDTPLAKLDSRHVKSIATKFFPSASHQVILLSQDREIDQSIYNALRSRIDHSFTISLGEQNKVKEGYFFD
jgi:DNA sulfur modification protein DndD